PPAARVRPPPPLPGVMGPGILPDLRATGPGDAGPGEISHSAAARCQAAGSVSRTDRPVAARLREGLPPLLAPAARRRHRTDDHEMRGEKFYFCRLRLCIRCRC